MSLYKEESVTRTAPMARYDNSEGYGGGAGSISEEDEEEIPPYVEEKPEFVIRGFIYQNVFDINYRDVVPEIVQYNVAKSMRYGDSFGMMMYLHDLKRKQKAAEEILRRKLMMEESKSDSKSSHNSITHKISHKYYEPT